ncbi:MAG: 2-oxoacid:acceptor oxidoreductase family protein [Spirochaetota bacterium]|nr:2-oxoacid:acceptor oxidoreductase family protein [Spirochaetota bacterium]
MYYDVIMAGFGGQGIQTISQIVALAAIRRGLNVTFLPSYGVEKRGGRTNVTLVIADEEIGSMVTNHPRCVIAMDTIAVDKYRDQVARKGLLIANTSLVPESMLDRNDITPLALKCNDEALALGSVKLSNMIALGAFLQKTKILGFDDVEAVMDEVTPERLKHTIPANLEAIRRGMEIAGNCTV